MLLLTVKPEEYVMIGDDIRVRILEDGTLLKLGIDAPKDMLILRSNLYEEMYPEAGQNLPGKAKKPRAPRKQGAPA